MNQRELVDRMRRLGGFQQDTDAEVALEATLKALGAVLLPHEREEVARSLPRALKTALDTPEFAVDVGLEAFFARVQHREKVSIGRAREHAQIACRALAEMAPPELVASLSHRLPRLKSLFELPEPLPPPDEPERLSEVLPEVNLSSRAPFERTLAGGRPGSRHPLSEARPERAHMHSVARSDSPHGDTKLSSSRGLTQEREHETLATGKPQSKRSLSQ